MEDKTKNKKRRQKDSRRPRSENALVEAEQKLDLALRGLKCGSWEVSVDQADAINPVLREIYLSPHLKALTGYEDHELPNSLQAWAGLILPEDLPLLQSKARAAVSGDADSHQDEYRIRHKDGGIRWHRLYGRLQREAHGAPSRWRGIIWDITERKQAEIALKESEEAYRAAFELAPVGVGHVSAEGAYLLVNQRLCEIVGYSAEELRGMSTHDITHPDDVQKGRDLLEKIGAGEIARYEREKRYLRKDGSVVWVHITVSTVRDSGGRPRYFITVVQDISERKKAEAALKESEERFRDLARSLPETIFELDRQGKLTFVNEQAFVRFGYTRRDFAQGLKGLEMIAPDDRERAAGNLEAILAGREVGLSEYTAIKKDGSTFPVLMHSTPIVRNKEAVGLRGFIVDISERIKAEKALKENEAVYRATFELAPLGVSHVSPDGRFLKVNNRTCQILGYTRDELELLNLSDITHPEDLQESQKNISRALSGHPPQYPRERRYLCKDGSIVWSSITASLVRDSQGRPKYFIALTEDITDRKKALEALHKSEERYRFIAENATDVIWQTDLKGNFQFLSPAFERLTGWSLKEGLSFNLKDIMAPDAYETTFETLTQRISANGHQRDTYIPPLILTLQALRKDGSSFTSEVSVKFLRDDQGRPTGITGVTRDISERKLAEESLKKLAGDLQKRVKELNCLYSISNFLGESDKSQDETLYSIVRLLPTAFLDPGKTCARIILADKIFETDDFKESAHKLARDIKNTQGQKTGAVEIFLKEVGSGPGEQFFLKEEVTLIDAIADRISDWLEKKRAEMEKQKVELQLRQAQKMEALGTLAGGIAHDFNNILAVIMGHTEIALEKGRIGEDATSENKRVLEAAVRASKLVKQILTFSRKVEIELKPLNLNQEIARSIKLLESTIPKMIAIEMQLAYDLKLIKADPNQMEQILVNLVTNAIDAMPSGGRLVIETKNLTLDEESLNGNIETLPGGYILWQISDTGEGIDEETQKHIFDPFFTTKEVGKGTGLGLSTVYGIVKSHGGHIICVSRPETGTVFKIYLPALQGDMHQIALEAEQYELEPQGKETVLVVDDEKAIRESTTEILKRRGYKLLMADSGEEALEIYKNKGGQIDLVILDVGMPGMGGLKCFAELVKFDPQVKVLMASGYSVEGQMKQTAALKAAGFIAKPYRLHEMLSKVREILGT